MAKIVNKPTLKLETHEVVALSKTIVLLKEIAKNEEMRNWYWDNVDQSLMATIESLDTLVDNIIMD